MLTKQDFKDFGFSYDGTWKDGNQCYSTDSLIYIKRYKDLSNPLISYFEDTDYLTLYTRNIKLFDDLVILFQGTVSTKGKLKTILTDLNITI